MAEGLTSGESEEAAKLRQDFVEAEGKENEGLIAAVNADNATDKVVKGEPVTISEQQAMAEGYQKLTSAIDEKDAAVLRAQRHVDEHLPEYKQTAAEEMKAETDKDYTPSANDSDPAVAQPPVSPESPVQQ